MNEHFLDTFDRAFIADPTEALKAVDDMATSLMSDIEQKRKAGVQELDPVMVKLQEDHAYLSGLHQEKTEELNLHQRLHKQAGIEIDNPFKANPAPAGEATKGRRPAFNTSVVKAVVSQQPVVEDLDDEELKGEQNLMTNDDIKKLAKSVSDKQTAAAQVEQSEGMDISKFKPETETKPLDLSGLDTFTMRKAEEAKEEDKPKKQDTDELDRFSNRYAGNDFFEKMKKKEKEKFSASSHAPVNFVPQHEIYKMFGNSIKDIKEKNNSRKITFNDTSYMTETAQGLSIVSEDRTVAAKRLTMMAVAKGWNSITFEGNHLFLEQAYEEATKAGLVVKPTSEEQAKIFRETHENRKLDKIMPFGGLKEERKVDIDKSIDNPGHEQSPVPVQAPIYTARLPTRMK
ncbi:LPD7 domain-containing protein [Klebsiella pneumoniae]|uniref:LPD7 domain-containing protein n=1 Tax=Klebsiella pneumoniae TaxID=573 RepID=UPI002961F6EC|nr:LPD7 domain-containing protein [Klebsiella pneumoniae]MDW1257562.1 LPD7 domain-containing protein [Klebsiella pneumoniae]